MISQYDGVVYIPVGLRYRMMAMSITADNLLPRPKLDFDVGYDAAVKGVSVVV